MTTLRSDAAAVPSIDLDPYAPEHLVDRTAFLTAVRETAPLVHLGAHDVFATGRFDVVREVLANWQQFQVGAGVGLANFHTEVPWRPPATPTEADPPAHDAPRRVLTDVLGARTLRRLRETWQAEADELVDRVLAGGGEVDAMADLASAFPLKVFPDAVGLPPDRRDDLLAYGDLVFNAFGPRNALFERSAARLGELSGWITSLCARENLDPAGFGAQIWAASDREDITAEQAPLVVRSLLSAGIDTTVHGIAWILHAFATHPEEWDRLRAAPELARRAFDEAVRWASPLQVVFHTTAEPVELAGVRLGKHRKIMLLLGAANHDPRRWEDPGRFTLDRDPSGHLGFGMGLHQCVGQHVARMEAEVLLTALARRVRRLEPAAPPRRGVNNTLQVWETLPLRLTK
ncbi:cytochrome P450 [Pseudonocardia abyssalis]|uniref:Cytochrome P450 n=1 Tax=Pseudonocardia abyssalis TaxID=2792008 RepID=A0ABS6URF3_9PSEU|nr:cytochrome P450 [Pseudonocardia abyssalis]MBW0113756.1 cytochrome P450 [Pseudonocardia abyssalis]MBW0134829.1 cytochrome P450 [Pseudonocardia abyssalis]